MTCGKVYTEGVKPRRCRFARAASKEVGWVGLFGNGVEGVR